MHAYRKDNPTPIDQRRKRDAAVVTQTDIRENAETACSETIRPASTDASILHHNYSLELINTGVTTSEF